MRKACFTSSGVAFILVVLLASFAASADHRFIESFDTKQYCDLAATTALWDTIAGELRLPPFVPSIVGSYNTAGNARGGIVIEGDYAYVADNLAGLQIVDITNLAAPTLAATYDTPGNARGVFIDGNYAFIADGATGLVIVSVTNPAAPAYVATYDTPGTARDVVVEGNYAFVADYASGIIVVNVTNPASPTLAGSYDTPGNAQGIAIAGNYAYVADGALGLQVINITTPASPTLAGMYNTPGTASDVEVAGDRAYIADGASGLQVINITTPASLTLISTLETAGDALGVAVERDRVYLAATGAMHEIDITDPAAPVAVHSIYTPGTAYGVVYEGVHAFVADDLYGLQIVQMSDPIAPIPVGAYPTAHRYDAVAVDGDYAYIAGVDGGVLVIDISDPANPQQVDSYYIPGGGSQHIDIQGDYAYVAESSWGVNVLNISNPSNVVGAGNYRLPAGVAAYIDVVGDYAYVAVGEAGLVVLNVSNPAAPTLASSYDTPFFAYGVAVQGDYAYVLDGETGLIVLNVSNPANPTHVVTRDTPDMARSIAIHGNYAYVADRDALQIFNIINPASPTIVDNYAVSGYVWNVACAGDYAYLARNDAAAAFTVLDISDPWNPIPAGSLALPREAWDVVVEGDLAFVADYEGGLQIIGVAQRDADLSGNVGRSTGIGVTPANVTKVKLTTDQIGTIEWELSANNGTGWDVVAPDGAWHPVTAPGTTIVWSSTHTMEEYGINPRCSRLQIDWLYEAASIDSVRDIPGDQGGKVRIYFARSGHDFAGDGSLIATYNVWRRVDGAATVREAAAAIGAGYEADVSASGAFGDLPVFKVGERLLMASNPTLEAAGLPSGVWEAMGSFSALQQDQYLFPSTTLADSTVEDGMAYAVYVVTAHTADPTVWYASAPDSGYSLDNLAPHVPTGFAVAYNSGSGNDLSWDVSPDYDFEYFKVYRGTSEDFVPGAGNLVETTIETDWLDAVDQGYLYFYKVSAVDHAGNESAPASAGTVTDADPPAMPNAFALHQNVPNPFNPTTRIRFDLPEAAGVRLAIYDVSGRKIRELASGPMAAGAREVTWDGRDSVGRAAASGIYFYRLDAGRFTQTRKMILLR